MYKWLTIMGIVCIGFIVVLLSLGYLLKENEVTTMALKKKLDQQKQLNSSDKSASKAVLTFVDNKQGEAEKLERYKNVIIKNITCTSSEQCMVVNTKKTELNCFVAVNTIGASLLNKALDKDVNKNVNKEYSRTSNSSNVCNVQQQSLVSVCKQNLCQLESEFK